MEGEDICPQIFISIKECEKSSSATLFDQSAKTVTQSGRVKTSAWGLLCPLVETGFLRLPTLSILILAQDKASWIASYLIFQTILCGRTNFTDKKIEA